ncbi:Pkinase-domain-containing protein [Pluteus cervinus]|uniref:Pkinase-domain-containing protein n=1 Tax=Pluteus cervinus TaxID=181527 RepID=A0ACD3AEZ1_9AGAR|nr:Pkinase-domain-containing protein [Pluteus cervinus]
MSTVRYPKVVGYELVQQIGGGGFSTVFRAVDVEEHRVAACKVIALTEQTTDKERKTIEKEMRVHSVLKHANVLEFLNAVVVELKFQKQFVPGIYILLELAAGGDLFDKIAPDVGVGDEVAHFYFNQLVSGMDYIHNQGVCHRDLKPENILLDVAGTLKISDFGLSSVYRLKEKTRMLTERCGSLPYVAPELSGDEPYHAEPIDVWGMGVILFALLVGNTPWDEPSASSPEFMRYLSGEFIDDQPWSRLPDMALSLITGMLTVEPRDRMRIADIVQHPWCMRQSQLASQGVFTLAEKLTQSLRANGDLGLAAPNFSEPNGGMDEDGDQAMGGNTHKSQFTQTLMLFSQTQSGSRYTPHLTRFYASLGPALLMTLIIESLESMGVKCKQAPKNEQPGNENSDALRLRIGGYDRRKVVYKGWVILEKFSYRSSNGSFCVMQRDVGNPISWRQLWKSLILSPAVEPHVLRK